MLALRVYLVFLKIGCFGFGGGFLMIPLFFMEIVNCHGWLTREQVYKAVALAQTVPGTLAGNSSVLMGLEMQGILLAAAALLGVTTPAFVSAFLADRFVLPYLEKPVFKKVVKGLAAVVAGVILGTGLSMAGETIHDVPAVITAVMAFVLFFGRSWNAAGSLITACLIGMVLTKLY